MMSWLARLRNLFRRGYGEGREAGEKHMKAEFQVQLKPWYIRKNRAAGELSSTPALLNKKELKQEMEGLNNQLEQVTRGTKELQDCLLSITEGSPVNNSIPYLRQNPLCEKLHMEYKQIRADLSTLENKNTEALDKFKELDTESLFYCNLQQQLKMEKTELENVVDKMRQETQKVLGEWILLQHYLGELKGICEEEEKLIRDLQTQKQQEQTRLEEYRQSQRKERELAIQRKIIAEKLQHYLAVSLMRSERLEHELEQASGHAESTL